MKMNDCMSNTKMPFFALLMNRVAEANGKELMQKNEELLTDPDAAVPDRLTQALPAYD